MRNGLNISNVSEFVHELRDNPIEADLKYRTRVIATSPSNVRVTPSTMLAGTIRVPRDFPFDAWAGAASVDRSSPSATELLLTAVGGCVVITFIYGVSSKGIIVSKLGAAIRLTSRPAVRDLANESAGSQPCLEYVIDAEAECDDRSIVDLVRQVTHLSPNHRTMVDPNQILFKISLAASDGIECIEMVAIDDGPPATMQAEARAMTTCHVEWQHGTQLRGTVPIAMSAAKECYLDIDVPKQYLGIDKAPNPQEYLLAALGTDIAARFWQLAAAERLQANVVQADLEGTVDIRGVMNLDPAAPVKVHAWIVDLKIRCEAPLADARRLVKQAIADSPIRALICGSWLVNVVVKRAGREIGRFSSP